MPRVHVRRAEPGELAIVMELLTEISAWLAARGIEQWPSPPAPEVQRLMAREIGAGEVYLARLAVDEAAGEGPVGLLRFEWYDAALWPDDPAGAGYVHTLGVRPAYQGQGLGVALLRWAAEHVQGRGRRYLRLDCIASNLALYRYYAALGFRFCGVRRAGEYAGALFEADAAALAGEPAAE